MADSGSIDRLIADYRYLLQFSWLAQLPIQHLPSALTHSYWIGEYTTNHYHPVEIIHPGNFQQLLSSLQQGSFYTQVALTGMKPVLMICSDRCSNEDTNKILQQYAIPILQSPVSARVILRELAHGFAARHLQQTVHGVMLSIAGHGVLLTGNSGIGKSALALELISRGHALVADDAPLLHRPSGTEQIFAVCPPLLADLLEVRALGILDVVRLFGTEASLPVYRLDLVIELVDDLPLEAAQRLQPFIKRINILGVDVTHLHLPIGYPANLAVIVETATRNHVLYLQGHDAGDILANRQQYTLSRQQV